MTERKILSSLRLNLVIFALASLAATNVFFNFLNPAQENVSMQNYLSYDNLSTMFVGLAAFLLFVAEIFALTKNKEVKKFFTFLKFVATVGSVVTLLYSYAVYLPMNYVDVTSLDFVLAYNGALFTRTLIPLLACYSLIFTDSYNKLRLTSFFFGPLLPVGYGVYYIVNQLFFNGDALVDYFDYVNTANRTNTIISTIAAFVGALILSMILLLLMRMASKDVRDVNKVVPEKTTKKADLNFATIEDNNEANNQVEPFEFGEGRKPKEPTVNYTNASLTDILGENKEESPELSKEISFSLEDNKEVEEPKKELSPLEKLNISLNEHKKQEEPKLAQKEEKVVQPQVKEEVTKPVTKPSPIPVVKEEKVEKKEEGGDFKAEKLVKNENPLNVKMPAAKKPAQPSSSSDDKDKDNRVYHVGKQKSGKWQVKLANGERAIRVFDTQKEAIDCAKELIKTQGGSYRIHSRQGKIRKE